MLYIKCSFCSVGLQIATKYSGVQQCCMRENIVIQNIVVYSSVA